MMQTAAANYTIGLHTPGFVIQAEQEAFDHAWADFGEQHGAASATKSSRPAYQFQGNNRFDGNPDALSIAQKAFQEGSLQDACLALEAVVKANPGAISQDVCWLAC
jgi:hypothetical protein